MLCSLFTAANTVHKQFVDKHVGAFQKGLIHNSISYLVCTWYVRNSFKSRKNVSHTNTEWLNTPAAKGKPRAGTLRIQTTYPGVGVGAEGGDMKSNDVVHT